MRLWNQLSENGQVLETADEDAVFVIMKEKIGSPAARRRAIVFLPESAGW